MIDKYGVEWAQQSTDIKTKTIKNNFKKYTVKNPTNLINYSNMNELIKFIKELNIDFDVTNNIISFKNCNIKIAYWEMKKDSSGSVETDEKISKQQYNLTISEEEKGNHILHIWETEWINLVKKEIWKSVIKHKLGLTENKIYARKCKVVEITNKVASEFCENNHLQGKATGGKCLGLMYQGDLVMVAIIAKPRYSKQFNYELLRLCSKINTIVIGGASKLLKDYHNLVSYANRRWSIGGVYKSSGFKHHSTSGICYWYFKLDDITKYNHRSKYQKHKLEKILKKYDSSLTEWENMKMNGYDRIWDCGNLVYVLK